MMNIYVGNLSYEATQDDVRAAFEAGQRRLAALPEGDPVTAAGASSAANQPTPGV